MHSGGLAVNSPNVRIEWINMFCVLAPFAAPEPGLDLKDVTQLQPDSSTVILIVVMIMIKITIIVITLLKGVTQSQPENPSLHL